MECKKEVEQPKAMLGHDLEETMDTSAPQIGKEKLDQDVSPEVKKSRLDQTEPVTEASADTQLAHSGHKDHSVVECPTNSEQDGQRMPDVHEEQSNVRKQNGNISASILLVEAKGMEQLDSSAPKGNNLQKPGKGAELHSSPKQQAKTPKKVLRGRRGDTKTATRPTKQLPSKSAGSNPPPLLFAHSGKPPSKYTPTIVQSFDDYFTQLWHAQRQVLHRLTWGDPVLVHSKQPSGTLDLQRKRKRVESIPGNLETTPKRWPDVGTARSPISGWLLQKSTHQEPSVGGENPVDVQSDFRNAGPFVHARIENTPGRRTLRLKRRPLSCREAEEGEPNISKLSVKGDFSIAERPIEVSRLDVPEAATVEYDLDEMLVSRNDESLQPSCSPKFPPQDTQNDDVVLITQTVACDTHSGTSHRSPNYNSSSSCATECSQNQQYKIQEQHTHTPDSIAGVSAASATPSNEEWITRKSRKPVHPSQNSTKELTRPVLHSSSRKRKRAHFMDESETEPEDDGGQDGHRAKRCSMGHEFQPTHLQRKSITPSNADDSSTEIESGPETLAVLPSSTSRHPQLPPLLFSIGSATRGRRRKREEATPTRKTLDKTAHLQCQAAR